MKGAARSFPLTAAAAIRRIGSSCTTLSRSLGGAPTVENTSLRCKPHNLYEARRDFGDEHVDGAIARSRELAHFPA